MARRDEGEKAVQSGNGRVDPRTGLVLEPLTFTIPAGFEHRMAIEPLWGKDKDNGKDYRVIHHVGRSFKPFDFSDFMEIIHEGEQPYVPFREEIGQSNWTEEDHNQDNEHRQENEVSFSIPGNMQSGKKRLWKDHSGDLADFVRAETVRIEIDGLFFLKKAKSMIETYGSEISIPGMAEVEVFQPRRAE